MPTKPPPLILTPPPASSTAPSARSAPVFSGSHKLEARPFELPTALVPNTRLQMDGVAFLSLLPDDAILVAFFDPQYRGVLDKLGYGNEGKTHGRRRFALRQMTDGVIRTFLAGLDRVLIPSGHVFLWVDKFHLCQGVRDWLEGTKLEIVVLVTWDKGIFGMGYRTRRRAEYCLVLQKRPRRAKGVWRAHTPADVVREPAAGKRGHPHAKPVDLQGELMAAVSHEGDYVIDPAAGSFSVLDAAISRARTFLGCDPEG